MDTHRGKKGVSILKQNGRKRAIKPNSYALEYGHEFERSSQQERAPEASQGLVLQPPNVMQAKMFSSKANRYQLRYLYDRIEDFYRENRDDREGHSELKRASMPKSFGWRLCKHCSTFFAGRILVKTNESDLESYGVELDNYTTTIIFREEDRWSCQLCRILKHRFKDALQPDLLSLTVRFWLSKRQGTQTDAWDIVFEPHGRNNSLPNLRLAMQPKYAESFYISNSTAPISSNNDHHSYRYREKKPKLTPIGDRAAKWIAICLGSHHACKYASPKGKFGFPARLHGMFRNANLEHWQLLNSLPLEERVGSHETCLSGSKASTFLPKRLLEVTKRSDSNWKIQLRETYNMDPRTPYVTLSHCWGNYMPFKLTSDNLRRCRKFIPFMKLSKTFQDAIETTEFLGFNFVWIDSLCIIQDSADDWLAESATMGDIYLFGAINLAATGFSNGERGFLEPIIHRTNDPIIHGANYAIIHRANDPVDLRLHRDQLGIYPDGSIELVNRAGDYQLIDVDTWTRGVEEAPLISRGWVVQERGLSPRTLHFGQEQMFWECLELTASEMYPAGFVSGTSFREPKILIRPNNFDSFDWNDMDRNYEIGEESISEFIDDSEREAFSGNTVTTMSQEAPFNLTRKMKSERCDEEETSELQSSMLSDLQSWLVDGYWSENFRPETYISLPRLKEFIRHIDLNSVRIKRLRIFETYLKKMSPRRSKLHSGASPLIPYKAMTQRQQKWRALVEAYSGCNLTFEKDKLVAISGIARMMEDDIDCEYLAGMWRKDLEHQLLWKVTKPMKNARRRRPSWSWASLDAFVTLGHWKWETNSFPGGITWLASVIKAETNRSTKDKFGQVTSGRLTLTGPLGVIRLEKDDSEPKSTDLPGFYRKRWTAKMFSDTLDLPKSQPLCGTTSFRRFISAGSETSSNWTPGNLDIFYMPIRLMDEFFDDMSTEHPILKGLLLKPTGKKNGEYKRIGMFETSDVWDGNCVQAFRCNRTDICSPEYFVSEHGTKYTITIV